MRHCCVGEGGMTCSERVPEKLPEHRIRLLFHGALVWSISSTLDLSFPRPINPQWKQKTTSTVQVR
jgi:hypothetical protein